jgi:hypothetical protein
MTSREEEEGKSLPRIETNAEGVAEIFVPQRSRNVSEVSIPDNLARDEEDSETQLLSNVEKRAGKGGGSNVADGFQPAVKNEQPPLGSENLTKAFGLDDPPPASGTSSKPKPSFAKMARKVYNVQKLARLAKEASQRNLNASSSVGFAPTSPGSSITSAADDQSSVNSASARSQGHRRAATLLAQIDEESNENGSTTGDLDVGGLLMADPDYRPPTIGDEAALLVSDPDISMMAEEPANRSPETLPLLNSQQLSQGSATFGTYAQDRRYRIRQEQRKKLIRRMAYYLNPLTFLRWAIQVIFNSTLLVAITFFAIAWFLYYHVGNPKLDFLPGRATLSWWLNFVGRHILLLELARVCQFLLIDIIVLGTRFTVKLFGPLATIFFIQSKGWPFCIFAAGILAMILLHGENEFQQHWVREVLDRVFVF